MINSQSCLTTSQVTYSSYKKKIALLIKGVGIHLTPPMYNIGLNIRSLSHSKKLFNRAENEARLDNT